MAEIRYSVKYNRIKRAYIEGFDAFEDGRLQSKAAIHNVVFFKPIDTAIADNTFGRLNFILKKSGNVTLSVYVAASNFKYEIEDESVSSYIALFDKLDAIKYVDMSDVLLYKLSGRYFYLGFEVAGEGDISIEDIRIYQRGDNFMMTFPQIYHERDGFFHRFMSVFSSIHNDLDEEIEKLPELLDLDTCDVKLLPIYGRWLGIDVGDGFLKDDILRALVKESYELNKMKGTKYVLERISEIILGERGIIVERNSAQDYLSEDQVEQFNELYGDNLNDVTLMIKQCPDSITMSQLEYILEQFLPINCTLHIVRLLDGGAMDGHVYLDINASVYKTGEGLLDSSMGLDGNVTLS